jgi:hypothetical protein
LPHRHPASHIIELLRRSALGAPSGECAPHCQVPQGAVARSLDQPTLRIESRSSASIALSPCRITDPIRPYRTRVARHISGENGGQPAFHPSRGQGGAPEPRRPIRSSALRAHSNREGETCIALSLTKRPICLARGESAEHALINGPPSVKMRRRLQPRQTRQLAPVERGVVAWPKKVRSCPEGVIRGRCHGRLQRPNVDIRRSR